MFRFFQILGGKEMKLKSLSRIYACVKDSEMTSHKHTTISCLEVWKREDWKKIT